MAQLKPGDYWKDPYERKYLKAPQPHDPASTLAHTVTGDYASPATWGNIYRPGPRTKACSCTAQEDGLELVALRGRASGRGPRARRRGLGRGRVQAQAERWGVEGGRACEGCSDWGPNFGRVTRPSPANDSRGAQESGTDQATLMESVPGPLRQ